MQIQSPVISLPRFLRWSAFRLRTKGLVILGLPVLPLAVFWLINTVAFLRAPPPTNTASRTLSIQAGLAGVFSMFLDAEGGVRDHLITNDAAARARYRVAIARLPAMLAGLDDSVIDTRVRQSLGTLKGVVADELAVLALLVDDRSLSPQPGAPRAELVRSALNLQRVRVLVASIDQQQTALAVTQAAQTRRASERLFFLLLGGSILCVGGGLLAALVMSGSLSRRIRRLTENADRLARGETIEPLPDGESPGEDEIAELDARFLDAALRLRQREQQLRSAVTDQHRLNASLQSRTTELEAANQEMEAFSYSVSHDLRAPLRAIDGFSHAIQINAVGRLDASDQDDLRRVRAAARRMGMLIDSLLDLSRLTRSTLKRQRLDLSAAARIILAELAERDPSRQVQVDILPGQVIHADSPMVQIMLQNLLENAWKYTRKTPDARIELASSCNGGVPVFHVRDNGAGFDMAYVSKLFGAFQRLHTDSEFEGIGVGLAIVQRIVHRHGGRIWADGATNGGAAFHFTLQPEDAKAA